MHYFSSIYIEEVKAKLAIFLCCVLKEQKEVKKALCIKL